MHTHQVIHRDLKLGNLFLDADMNIKVGDFGLAALIEGPGERKKTISGTPTSIAPEVLFDTANGHGFEVEPGPLALSYTLLSLAVCLSRPSTSKKFISRFFEMCSPVLC